MTATLVTIAFSHYCEKGRWALDRARVPYREEAYVPLTHLLGTLPRGGRSTPLLALSDGTVLTDSSAIVRYADAVCPGSLLPADPALSAEVTALEALFDEELGPHVRRLAYGVVLASGRPFAPLIAEMTTGWQRAMSSLLGVIVPRAVKRGLRIDAEGIARSQPRVEKVLERVEALLADGRRYLVGETFTAADLTFAALYSPLLSPPEQPVTGPVEGLASLGALTDESRSRPAGVFALRLYAEERRRIVG